MSKELETLSKPSRRRQGQALAEFALTLPILLLLMFGIIEFARAFQAWVTLQNAARTAARYAATGQFDPDYFLDLANGVAATIGGMPTNDVQVARDRLCQTATLPNSAGSHVPFGPYAGGYEMVFANYWDGTDCDPGDEEDEGLLNDLVRIPSIRDQARIGAAGLDVRLYDERAYQMEVDANGNFVRWTNDNVEGWFHVFICSSRLSLREDDAADVMRYNPMRAQLTCNVTERRAAELGDSPVTVNNGPTASKPSGNVQWDAGGPGDAVEIIITFNHPLITPLALPAYIPLQARRVMINEAFRASRVINLPPVLAVATNTPTNTPLPTSSYTPSPSYTPSSTPSITPTPTSTSTPTATATPDCNDISISQVMLNGAFLQVAFHNGNPSDVHLLGVSLQWRQNTTYFPNMYVDYMIWNGEIHWNGQDSQPPTNAGTAPSPEPTWDNNADVLFQGNTDSLWQARFANGPVALANYFSRFDFVGSTWYFSGNCAVVYNDAPPTATPTGSATPTIPPIDCGYYVMNLEGFWTNAVVQFSIRNGGYTPIQITGMDLRWVYYFDGMVLDFVQIGGANAFDPAGIRIWDGNDTGTTVGQQTNTASGTLGTEPTWLINAVVNPGDTVNMWLDFDGLAGSLQTYYNNNQASFNGTLLAFDNGCNAGPGAVPTPVPTIPIVCGNGIVQAGEACDPPNATNCNTYCQWACGDGTTEASRGEQCDPPNGTSCSGTCQWQTWCGDGIRQTPNGNGQNEQCDDGNTSNRDACLNNCTNAVCGDGYVRTGVEQCDDGNTRNGDGCSSTCQNEPPVCGNGRVESGEQCDDGNTRNGDGCSSTCQNEPPVCRNGRVESGEQCDDGNSVDTDSCRNNCTWAYCGDGVVCPTCNEQCEPPNTGTCNSSCQTITAACGNGVIESGEQCDDGNTRNGDGCSSTCQIEQGCWDCG